MKLLKGRDIDAFIQRFESRRLQVSREVETAVQNIIQQIKQRGDEALFEFALKFDQVDLSSIPVKVPLQDLQSAYDELDSQLLKVLKQARDNIKSFHEKALPQSWLSWEEDEIVLGQRVMPIERVGIYVPGGLAAYPSSLLMAAVPAQVAGVKEIVVVTPSDADGNINSTILAAAHELGINQFYRIGGAHAVAALALGTESIPRVDKIVGPGNIYVATAKKILFGQCGIDMIAGPSEVLIIADVTANPVYVAADLLAQAEHDPLASAILVTNNEMLAETVLDQLSEQMQKLARSEIISQSLSHYGAVIVVDTLEEAIDLSNRMAPEHLGIHCDSAWDVLAKIKNAGAIFLGHYSPEAVGDYWAGPNHVLPTNGSARFFSPLRAQDFLKVSSVIRYSKTALDQHGEAIQCFARHEGLDAHAASIAKRMIP